MELKTSYVFLLGGHDLEMAEISRILDKYGILYHDNNLGWNNAKLSSYSELFNNNDRFVGIELTTDIAPPKNYLLIDHHNENVGKPSAIEQVAELLGIELTREQQLIAANDKGFIPAMEALGATPKEIAEIRRLDQIFKGETIENERLQEQTISKNMSTQKGKIYRSLFSLFLANIKWNCLFIYFFSYLKPKKYQRKISIESIKTDTYKKAEYWFKGIQWFNYISFSINIAFLFLSIKFLSTYIYYIIVIAYVLAFILINVLIFICDKYYSKYRVIAEELRIIQFNKANLNIEISPEKKSYFLPCIIPISTFPYNVEFNYDANYFENQNLKFSLLQNIFFTQQNYTHHAKYYCVRMGFLLFIAIVVAIIGSISISLKSNIQGSWILILQFILSFLNLIIATRYLIISKNFQHKAEILKDIDVELVKTNSENENKALSLLIEYNSLLVDSYPTFTCIYNKHQNVLNVAWNERVTSYDKTKLLSDFKDNIEKDLKLLLSSLKKIAFKENVIIGSYLDNSFVNGKSDLDILLVFENNCDITPKEFYFEIHKVLKIRFGNNLIESLPAFIIKSFGDITLEFTPCIQIESDKYHIVNSSYQFEEICPQKYSEYFKTSNYVSDGLFYSLAKEIISCKYEECFSITSIYLKIYLSEFIQDQESDKTLFGFFKELVKNQLKEIENFVEPHKPISPCPEKEKKEILEKIKKFIKENENGKLKNC